MLRIVSVADASFFSMFGWVNLSLWQDCYGRLNYLLHDRWYRVCRRWIAYLFSNCLVRVLEGLMPGESALASCRVNSVPI